MKLIPLPALVDNYIWMLHDGQQALVVDPGDAQPVLQALQRENVQLAGILVTHHHKDHTGGVHSLQTSTGAPVFGPAKETIPEPLTRLNGGDHVHLLGIDWHVLDVPGHTAGHIAYFGQHNGTDPWLFCGDTLFSAGCGRIFDGTVVQLEESLRTLASLPEQTCVCCTHEYTLSNLQFAQTVEPDNVALANYQTHCQQLRAKGMPTLPSQIALEKQINPFLRTTEPSVIASTKGHDAAGTLQHGVFATLRQWKNHYP
jgi:hydroxyacylglutathione hydrolase